LKSKNLTVPGCATRLCPGAPWLCALLGRAFWLYDPVVRVAVRPGYVLTV
jgi:hypothetical protein